MLSVRSHSDTATMTHMAARTDHRVRRRPEATASGVRPGRCTPRCLAGAVGAGKLSADIERHSRTRDTPVRPGAVALRGVTLTPACSRDCAKYGVCGRLR